MGTLAESVKSAEAKVAAEINMFEAPKPQLSGRRGKLYRSFSDYMQRANRDPYKDLMNLSRYMPTSGQEALNTGLKYTGIIGGAGASLAALASLFSHLQTAQRRQNLMSSVYNSGTGREVSVPFKFAANDDEGITKEGVGLGTAAIIAALVGTPLLAYNWGAKHVSKVPGIVRELFTPTSNPLTHPLAVPLMIGGGAALTAGSYKLFDHLFDKMREKRRKREMDDAEKEFNTSLRAQYESPKAASIGEAIDGLAEAHVSGELQQQLSTMEKGALSDMEADADPTKPAPWYRGMGSGGVGLYATLALLLALGGGVGAYSVAKKRDNSRRRQIALKNALRRRAMASPPQFIVEKPFDMGEEPV